MKNYQNTLSLNNAIVIHNYYSLILSPLILSLQITKKKVIFEKEETTNKLENFGDEDFLKV